jgi:hypothetical protein
LRRTSSVSVERTGDGVWLVARRWSRIRSITLGSGMNKTIRVSGRAANCHTNCHRRDGYVGNVDGH